MDYFFDTYMAEVHPLLTDVDGYEAFEVNVRPTGTDPRGAMRFEVLRPEGPTGPFRQLVIARDVLHDLFRGSLEGDAYIDYMTSTENPPEGPVRDAYLTYVERIRAEASPLSHGPLGTAFQTSVDMALSKLRSETGATDVSLHNAKVLLNRYGLPDTVSLYYYGHPPRGEPPAEFAVVAEWDEAPAETGIHRVTCRTS